MNTISRLMLAATVAVLASACTPKVGIAPQNAKPSSSGKPVMVVPTDAIAGESGDRIELAAWGFTEANATRVWFGGTVATDVKVVDGWRVEVVVPQGTGRVDVCIENAAGAWVLLEAFQYAEGTGVEHCWPSSAILAKVEAAKKRIAEAKSVAATSRVAALTAK